MLHFLQTEGQTRHQQGYGLLRCSGLGPHLQCPHGALMVDVASLSGLWHGMAFEDSYHGVGESPPLSLACAFLPWSAGDKAALAGPAGSLTLAGWHPGSRGGCSVSTAGARVDCHLPTRSFMRKHTARDPGTAEHRHKMSHLLLQCCSAQDRSQL